MINLQVQQHDTKTGKREILFTMDEIQERHKDWYLNELHLMYEDRATETRHIKVVEVVAS